MEKAGRKQREDFAMTETKYIFPKQMQSVAALVFIAVLIVLLLILTVMVHMRNRKTEKYAGRTDSGKTAFGQNMCRFYGCLLC